MECDRVGAWGGKEGWKKTAEGLEGKLKVLMREGRRDRWREKTVKKEKEKSIDKDERVLINAH